MHTDPLKQLWHQAGGDADDSEATAALNSWRRHRQYAAQRQLSAFSALQVVQLLFWLGLSMYCGSVWWQQPPLAVMLSAVALHVYCVAVIIVSAARLHLRGQLQPDQPQRVIAQAAHLLSNLSHFVGVVTAPKRASVFHHIEFLRLGERRVLVILVSPDGDVQNRVIFTARDHTQAELVEALADHPIVGEIRTEGLIGAIEIVQAAIAGE